MGKQRQQSSFNRVVVGLGVALASTSMACDFPALPLDTPDGIHEILDKAPLRHLAEGDRWTVYEDLGRIRVQHGYGCLEVGVAATKEYLGFRVSEEEVAPRGTENGVVILNGWDLTYTNGDHTVKGLGTAIFNVTDDVNKLGERVLHWEAGGVLSDDDGQDAYKWCYRYTLLFWNPNAFDASAFQADDPARWTTFVAGEPIGGATALKEIQAKFTSDGGSPRAVVPRGFGLTWEIDDHHVLQVGFDQGTPSVGEIIVPTNNHLAWTSQMVLKDNEPSYPYNAAEIVTVLSGQDVEMWQPRQVLHEGVPEPTQLILQAAESCGTFCVGTGEEEHLDHYSIENVPYEFAVPVLTGWDLQYATEDHHVERIGVYLVEFDYVKAPNTLHGTLNYTIFSTLRDDADNGLYQPKYKVSVLGLNNLGGGAGGGKGGREGGTGGGSVPPRTTPVVPQRQFQ